MHAQTIHPGSVLAAVAAAAGHPRGTAGTLLIGGALIAFLVLLARGNDT